jgi:hypothetical protein
MNEKLIIKNPVVTMDPNGTPVDLSPYCKNFSLSIKKEAVDVAAYGDPAGNKAKGVGDHEATVEFFHARAMSAFLAKIAEQYVLDEDTEFDVKYKNESIGVDNLKFSFACLVNSIGQLGGQRGQASMLSATWPINGQVTMYDGTTTTLL